MEVEARRKGQIAAIRVSSNEGEKKEVNTPVETKPGIKIKLMEVTKLKRDEMREVEGGQRVTKRLLCSYTNM